MKLFRSPREYAHFQQAGGGFGFTSRVGGTGTGTAAAATPAAPTPRRRRLSASEVKARYESDAAYREMIIRKYGLPKGASFDQYWAASQGRRSSESATIDARNPAPAAVAGATGAGAGVAEQSADLGFIGTFLNQTFPGMMGQMMKAAMQGGGGEKTPVTEDGRGENPDIGFDEYDPDPLGDYPEEGTTPPPGGNPPGPTGGGEGGVAYDPATWDKNPLQLPGFNVPWLAALPGLVGALGKDPEFNRMETSHNWRADFQREFEGVSKDARDDPYYGSFFRNANRAAQTATNTMIQADAAKQEAQRQSGGQMFVGGTQRAVAGAAPGFYANQGNLLSRGYDIRNEAANMENRYTNENTNQQQQLFEFEVAQGTHPVYNRGLNLVNRALSGAMGSFGAGLDIAGKMYDYDLNKALLEKQYTDYTMKNPGGFRVTGAQGGGDVEPDRPAGEMLEYPVRNAEGFGAALAPTDPYGQSGVQPTPVMNDWNRNMAAIPATDAAEVLKKTMGGLQGWMRSL